MAIKVNGTTYTPDQYYGRVYGSRWYKKRFEQAVAEGLPVPRARETAYKFAAVKMHSAGFWDRLIND